MDTPDIGICVQVQILTNGESIHRANAVRDVIREAICKALKKDGDAFDLLVIPDRHGDDWGEQAAVFNQGRWQRTKNRIIGNG